MRKVDVPSPVRALELREKFLADSLVCAAVEELRVFGVQRVCEASYVLSVWHSFRVLGSRREQAVLAFWVPEPAEECATCQQPIEYVTDGPDPGWWRHGDGASYHTRRGDLAAAVSGGAGGLLHGYTHGAVPFYSPDGSDGRVVHSTPLALGGEI